jgi:hypothetical protein
MYQELLNMSALAVAGRLLAMLTAGFVWGATAWFFFVQSPVLLKFLGKAKVGTPPCLLRCECVLFPWCTSLNAVP